MMRLFLLCLLTVGVAFTAWTCLAQVEPGERGVVMRFGRVVENVGPGLYIGLPWGIDRVERVAVDRVRQVTIGMIDSEADDMGQAVPAGQLLTGDHNLVNVQVVVQYSVDDTQVEQFVQYGNAADGLVARTAETVLAEWVAGRGVDDVLLRGKELLPYWVVSQTQRRVAPYGLGVQVQLATVNALNPPPQVRSAFEAVNSAQNEIQREVNRASQDADAAWSQAQSYKFKLETRAKVDAAATKNLAHVEADAFLKRLAALEPMRKQNPSALATLWLDEVTKIYSDMRAAGRLDLLDNRLAGEGIDILQNPLATKKK